MLEVLFEDNHLIAVNKPAGTLVHGDKTGDRTLADEVKAYIKKKYDKPGDVFLGVIHRLDRPASGLTIFARTSKALERMNRMFSERKMEKTYWAVVGKRPNPIEGSLEHYLWKDTEKNKVKAFNSQSKANKGAKLSRLDYRMIGGLGHHYLLEVDLHTGRPHQIRVQLAKAGYPIIGDIKYGFSHPNKDASVHLHSFKLSFIHPVKKEPVNIIAPPPKDQVWDMFREIGEEK